jgi:hypothetical protein
MDTYTKVVLTVIALALSVLAIENVMKPAAAAQGTIERVTLCKADGSQCGFGADQATIIYGHVY